MTRYALSVLPSIDAELKRVHRILIAADFDGTLCPIAESPSGVRIAPHMVEVLRQISACSRMTLAVISGRALADVASRLPVPAVCAGNHGLEIRGPGLDFEHECARRLRPEVKSCCEELSTVLAAWPGAWVEDKGLSATVHYRQVPHEHQPLLCRAVRRTVLARVPSLRLRAGLKALELYPKVGWGKGTALEHIRALSGPFDLCICLGDDETDEDMFVERPAQINIKVGDRPTRASLRLAEPSGVAVFLAHVLDVCTLVPEQTIAAAPASAMQ